MINSSDNSETPRALDSSSPLLDALPTEEFLRLVGLRVRSQRAIKNMSRKRLAEVSGVSERYLAQLESGQGNMSITLLRKVTTSIGMSLSTLLSSETPELGNTSTGQQHTSGSSDAMQTAAANGNGHVMNGRNDRLGSNSHILREPGLT